MRAQGRQMLGCAIPFVSGKTVLRVLRVELNAPAVALYLGQNRCCRDRWHGGVAPNDRFGENIKHRQAVTVHQHLGRLEPQTLDGAAHGQQRGLQDVELIDLFNAGLGDRTTQGFGTDLVKQVFAASCGQHL